ncbi:MAG: BatD family protein [Fuerstiella sp.]|nr:BatD family protein [Fuerstiella sp.]
MNTLLIKSVIRTVVVFSTLLATVNAQSPDLLVEIDRQQIFEGESFLYQITLNHVENPSAPDLDGFDEFQVTSLGTRSLNSSQITIINGRRSEVVRRGQQYNYRLTPKKNGVLTIPAPVATVDGEILKGREIEVRVVAPESQDTVVLDYSVDHLTVYPTQPFTVSLVIAVRELPDRFHDRDPLTVQQDPPVLSVPWLDDNQLADGLQPQQRWQEILEPIISRQGHGFQINNIGSSSAFSFFENRATGFHPSPRKSVRKDSAGNDTNYTEYEFQRTFVSQHSGQFDLGPVSLKGTFADSLQNGRLIGTEFYAVAKNVGVTVKDVPTSGQPESYIGAVGVLTVDANLAPSAVRVGDPITLTVQLAGKGTLENTHPPQIARMSSVVERFRTYDATQKSADNTRTFIYSLRPLNAAVTEFPPIPVSYFDVETEQYVTLHTDAIPIAVSETETLSETDIIASAKSQRSLSTGPERRAGGVFANVSNLDALHNEQVHAVRWFATWGTIVIGWFGLTTGIGYIRQRYSDPTLKRRRKALATAEVCLKTAESHLEAGDSVRGCDSIHRAIAGVIAAWAGIPEEGLTARDAAAELTRMRIDSGLASQAAELLENCDAARYGAVSDDVSLLLNEARQLIQQIVNILRRRGSNSS